MLKSQICLLLAASSIFAVYSLAAQQLQRHLETEKGTTRDALVVHPLSWWTTDPLRLDSSGDLMLGFKGLDGQPLTAKDYRSDERVVTIGTLSRHRIVQILTTIRPGPGVIAAGFAKEGEAVREWKDLLVGVGDGKFVEIYALHFDVGGQVKETTAEIYGSEPNAILGSYDPDTGNGGGCFDGYWWFDKDGAHAVDFSPLIEAVSRALPANAVFTPNCWALHPDSSELKSWVQRKDAKCHACGGLGEVKAEYQIEHGVAKAVSVSYEPEQTQ